MQACRVCLATCTVCTCRTFTTIFSLEGMGILFSGKSPRFLHSAASNWKLHSFLTQKFFTGDFHQKWRKGTFYIRPYTKWPCPLRNISMVKVAVLLETKPSFLNLCNFQEKNMGFTRKNQYYRATLSSDLPLPFPNFTLQNITHEALIKMRP